MLKRKRAVGLSASIILFLFYRAKAFSAAMGAFGDALAVHVYADGKIVPLRLDLSLAFGANVGAGEDNQISHSNGYDDKENCRKYNRVPRRLHRFAKPIDLAGGKSNYRA